MEIRRCSFGIENKILSLLLGLWILALAAACTPSSESGPGLGMSLMLDSSNHQVGQPISVTLVLENTNSEPLLFQNRMAVNIRQLCPAAGCDMHFMISDPDGKDLEFRWLARVRSTEQTDFVNISPGEKHKVELDLAQYYAPFDKVGKYTAKVVYENQTDPSDGRLAWKGKLTSNTVTFTLEP